MCLVDASPICTTVSLSDIDQSEAGSLFGFYVVPKAGSSFMFATAVGLSIRRSVSCTKRNMSSPGFEPKPARVLKI